MMLLHFKAASALHFTTSKKIKKYKDLSFPAFELEANVQGSIQVISFKACQLPNIKFHSAPL
jgi:hypothetical protein